MKNRFTIIFIIVIIILVAIYCAQIIKIGNEKHNEAISGKIDINNDYLDDFGYVSLGGQWGFYPDEFIAQKQLDSINDAPVKVKFPGAWKDDEGIEGKRGYGTYLLEFENIDPNTEISFLFAIAPSEAYEVCIDSQKVLSVGEIGITKETVKPKYKSAIIDATISDGSIMTIHASNLSYHSGGYVRPITAGYKENISHLKRNILIKDILVLGSLLLMLFVILVMTVINKKNRILLIYFLIADLISISYVLSTGDIIIQSIFPDIPFIVHYTMYYLMSISGGTMLILVVDNLYGEISSKIIKYISLVKMVVLYLLFFLAKDYFVGSISNIKDILVLIEFLYCIIVLIIGIKNKRKNILLTLVGVVILLLSVLWDMMYAYSFIFTSFELIIPYGLTIFVLCFMISMIKEYQIVYLKAFEYKKTVLELNQEKDASDKVEEKALNIKLLGSFEVYRKDGSQVHFRTKKAKELMAYMVHHKNKELVSDTIIHDLWEDKPYGKAKGLLYTSFYYLRREFNTQENTIFSKKYILEDKHFFSDFDMFEKTLNELSYIDHDKISESNITDFETLISSYKKGYFGIDNYTWANDKQVEIEKTITEVVNHALDYYMNNGQVSKEIELCEKMLDIDEFQEKFYQRLMKNYKKADSLVKYEETKRRYESAMKELGIEI